MTLSEYRRKRPAGRSPEPRGKRTRRSRDGPGFVIQHHAARSDHYDFRLEIDLPRYTGLRTDKSARDVVRETN